MTTPLPGNAAETVGGKAPRVKWLPLEADPVLLAQYVNSLGGPVSCAVEADDATERRHEAPEAVLSFEDVLSLEDWAIDMARNPTVAVLLVYPLREDEPRQQQPQQEQAKGGAEEIWFTKQTVGNACGTIALLHCIANLPRARFPLQPNGILETFFSFLFFSAKYYSVGFDRSLVFLAAPTATVPPAAPALAEETASLSPAGRARALEKSTAFAAAHHAFETRGQSAVPAPDKADVDTHYVTFVFNEKSSEIVELDGRKSGPVFHKCPPSGGAAADHPQHLLRSAAAVIRDEFIAKSKGDLRFQLIAVGDAQAGRQQRQLQL